MYYQVAILITISTSLSHEKFIIRLNQFEFYVIEQSDKTTQLNSALLSTDITKVPHNLRAVR